MIISSASCGRGATLTIVREDGSTPVVGQHQAAGAELHAGALAGRGARPVQTLVHRPAPRLSLPHTGQAAQTQSVEERSGARELARLGQGREV